MTKKTILVCDDDELLVELLTYRLEGKGYAVATARNGAEAIALAGERTPDAIVLDMMMPVMDGQQVLRRLRESPETAHIPIVMLTARKQEHDILGAFELGASDYLVKPFIPEELMTRLARLFAAAK